MVPWVCAWGFNFLMAFIRLVAGPPGMPQRSNFASVSPRREAPVMRCVLRHWISTSWTSGTFEAHSQTWSIVHFLGSFGRPSLETQEGSDACQELKRLERPWVLDLVLDLVLVVDLVLGFDLTFTAREAEVLVWSSTFLISSEEGVVDLLATEKKT